MNRIKKVLFALLSFVLLFGVSFGLASCDKDKNKTKVYLITDIGGIDDHAFNEGCWSAVQEFVSEHEAKYKSQYLEPTKEDDASYAEAIAQAVADGAKIIICPGFLFNKSVEEATKEYPEVKFIFVDGGITDEKKLKERPNLVNYTYKEQDAGFLAGYALAKRGHKKVGFYGGLAVPAVVRFGLGYINGFNYGLDELKIDDDIVKNEYKIKYIYSGHFKEDPKITTMSGQWLDDGVEAIFTCGGALYNSVDVSVTNKGKGFIVGVDSEQTVRSNNIITSAAKELHESVIEALTKYDEGKWDEIGGKHLVGKGYLPTKPYKTKIDGKEVEHDPWDRMVNNIPQGLNKFTVEEYEAVFSKLTDGTIKNEMPTGELGEDTKIKSRVAVEWLK